jgi:hypothetical protein
MIWKKLKQSLSKEPPAKPVKTQKAVNQKSIKSAAPSKPAPSAPRPAPSRPSSKRILTAEGWKRMMKREKLS